MKISPMASGSPMPVNGNEGMSADPGRLAKAKAIASGQTPVETAPHPDAQVERAQNSIKKIKMRTQRSPDRHERMEEAPIAAESTEQMGQNTPIVENSTTDTPAPIEQTDAALEANKPLSPQFAALARQKREAQVALQKVQAEKIAFEAEKQKIQTDYIPKSELKANALKVLLANGVTYDQLTEQILANNEGERLDVPAIEAKLKADLEEGLDKRLSERESRQEEAYLSSRLDEAELLAKEGDAYQLIREADAFDQVLKRIYGVYKKTGRAPDTTAAMEYVENQLLEESLKWAKIQKVQSRLLPPAPQQKQPPAQPDRPNTKIMRTLTNRDGVSSTSMSKRERAIAAMEGRLK